MKKIILSIAIIAGVITTTSIQTADAGERPIVNSVYDNDGFVDVKLEDLNEQVQAAINELTSEYGIQALKYSSEKQLTKVKLTKRDDQSSKTVYFSDEGEQVENDMSYESLKFQHQEVEMRQEGQELQEQQLYQQEQQRQQQQHEGQEQQELQQQQNEGQELQQQQEGQQPSVEQSGVTQDQDNGFQNITFEDLNENVQEAVRKFADQYDITVLQYNNNKKIAKVTGRNKEDQSGKTIHLNDEGKEVNLDAERAEAETEQTEREETQTPKG